MFWGTYLPTFLKILKQGFFKVNLKQFLSVTIFVQGSAKNVSSFQFSKVR